MFHNLTPNGVLQFEQVPTISSVPLFSDTIVHVLVTLSSLIFVRPETNIQIKELNIHYTFHRTKLILLCTECATINNFLLGFLMKRLIMQFVMVSFFNVKRFVLKYILTKFILFGLNNIYNNILMLFRYLQSLAE